MEQYIDGARRMAVAANVSTVLKRGHHLVKQNICFIPTVPEYLTDFILFFELFFVQIKRRVRIKITLLCPRVYLERDSGMGNLRLRK